MENEAAVVLLAGDPTDRGANYLGIVVHYAWTKAGNLVEGWRAVCYIVSFARYNLASITS